MLFHTLRVHQNVINENHDRLVQLLHEHGVHEMHMKSVGALVNPNDMTRYS
jgi:hypothetical protein